MGNIQRIPAKNPTRIKKSPFNEFSRYENGRNRSLKFDVNALADFEQETGMGFGKLMQQRAVFASARAMLWAGMKHEDRALSIEDVGTLLDEYLRDEGVPAGSHTLDTILMVAIQAAVEQGALGRQVVKKEDEEEKDGNILDIDSKNESGGDDAPPTSSTH